jgi:uncharacterized protein (TIGR04255 family)
VEPERLNALASKLHSRYPVRETRRQFKTHVRAGPKSLPDATTEDLGFHAIVLKDAKQNESRVIQLRIDGFTLSQLSGYTTADDLFKEAFDIWPQYAEAVKASSIARAALRYINDLALPLTAEDDLGRFLVAPIPVPSNSVEKPSSFLTRAVIPLGENYSAIVIQRFQRGEGTQSQFTLDIDVYRIGEFSTGVEAVEPLLQELRSTKNRLFFSFLTDAALEAYR